MTELDQSDCPVRRPKAVKADLAPRPVMEPLDRDIPSPQLHTLTVLVVDDDDGVRRTIARQLEQGGFRVLSAWNGVEALAVLEQPGVEVHLVVTDLLMPQLDGYQLADRLATLPNPPEVIFVSAFRSDLELEHPIFTKPFHLDDLTEAVQRILQQPSKPLHSCPPPPVQPVPILLENDAG
ncbi:MAG TPA: response regulator [Gemmatimonadales bacterium]|nr:response regulator [Gemmatimonadales bacterium]